MSLGFYLKEEQPAQQQDIADLIAGALGVSRGTAYDMMRKALAEAQQQEPVNSIEKAGAFMEAKLWEFIDMAAAWPEAKPDARTWAHVMAYAPPAQQEPKFSASDDAERLKSVGRGMSYNDASEAVWKHTLMEIAMRLETGGYTSPPASKPWVGLTDDERVLCVQATVGSGDAVQLMCAIEAKLREKNAQPSKPLTDEQITAAMMRVEEQGRGYFLRLARAIETAHGITGDA